MDNIKLIIFDLDGTLVNAYAAINSSFNYVMMELGLKPQSAGSIRRAVGWGDANLLTPSKLEETKNGYDLFFTQALQAGSVNLNKIIFLICEFWKKYFDFY